MKYLLSFILGLLFVSITFNVVQHFKEPDCPSKPIEYFVKDVIRYRISSAQADSIRDNTIDSLKRVNSARKERLGVYYDTLDYYKTIYDTVKIVITQDSIIYVQREVINNQDDQLEEWEKIDSLRIESIKLCDSTNTELIGLVDSEQKKRKKWRKAALITGGIAIIEGIIISVKK